MVLHTKHAVYVYKIKYVNVIDSKMFKGLHSSFVQTGLEGTGLGRCRADTLC